jgi:hypothetical protein
VTIPDGVTGIGTWAFIGCGSLTNVVIGTNVVSIAGYAFEHCTSLTTVRIGSGVTNVQSRVFAFCPNLTAVFFLGSAPGDTWTIFYNSTNAIVYYLPGTTNWGPSWGSRPTALWRPKIQTRDTPFGVHTNQFAFNIAWASGMNIAVDACTNLTDPVWLPLQTNTLTADTFYFTDPDWTNFPRRCYRVRWP